MAPPGGLSKVLGHICVKVPPSHIPEEEIQRKRHVVQRPPFHVERSGVDRSSGRRVHCTCSGGFSVAAPLEGLETG